MLTKVSRQLTNNNNANNGGSNGTNNLQKIKRAVSLPYFKICRVKSNSNNSSKLSKNITVLEPVTIKDAFDKICEQYELYDIIDGEKDFNKIKKLMVVNKECIEKYITNIVYSHDNSLSKQKIIEIIEELVSIHNSICTEYNKSAYMITDEYRELYIDL